MESTSNNVAVISERDVFYFRYRYRNRVFQSVMAYFASVAERKGLTKSQIASALGKDPAQITRWFPGPSNWTLDTISDLLLAMEAEMSDEIIPFDSYAQADTETSLTDQVLLQTEPNASTTGSLTKWKVG